MENLSKRQVAMLLGAQRPIRPAQVSHPHDLRGGSVEWKPSRDCQRARSCGVHQLAQRERESAAARAVQLSPAHRVGARAHSPCRCRAIRIGDGCFRSSECATAAHGRARRARCRDAPDGTTIPQPPQAEPESRLQQRMFGGRVAAHKCSRRGRRAGVRHSGQRLAVVPRLVCGATRVPRAQALRRLQHAVLRRTAQLHFRRFVREHG
mmetsp:Transcript_14901/g.39460  ORF Transcript_14901/g.39460 Transcript_14901/m.39460 type:complete len:208 (-) Transcript_14901:1137-1760(-)